MIVVRLFGGLGNQMFQYALGRKLATKFNTNLVLEISSFEKDPLREFSLGEFAFVKRFAAAGEWNLFGLRHVKNITARIYCKIFRKLFRPVIIREKQFNFDHAIFKSAKKYTWLDGYWQTEKYFSDIRDILINDFTIKKPLENKNMELADRIRSVNSVSLHIRRADYVSNPDTLKYHGLCDLEYYNKAIELIAKKVKDPVLFVFSDDMPWVRENIRSSFDIFFVDFNNSDTSYEDMRLMSLCKHNIIANSSFSWWGAWLNTNESKIVISPARWFADSGKNYNDVIPEKWIKI